MKLGYSPFLPHLTHLWELINPHEVDYWYNYDNDWLLTCDAVLRLPGESPGSDAEEKLARENSMPVFYSIDKLARSLGVQI